MSSEGNYLIRATQTAILAIFDLEDALEATNFTDLSRAEIDKANGLLRDFENLTYVPLLEAWPEQEREAAWNNESEI